jgi:hypothetical protein
LFWGDTSKPKLPRVESYPSLLSELQVNNERSCRSRRREELCGLIGNYDGFTLSMKKLKRMRNDA